MRLLKQIIFLIALFALGIVIALLALEQGRTINLIENPSFEVDDDQDGLPDCWCLISNYPNDYYLDTEEKVFGDVSLKMETYCHPTNENSTQTVGSGGACLWREVKPNTAYTLSYYVKTERPEDVLALPYTWEYGSDGNLVGQHYSYLDLSPGWQRVVMVFTTHPDTEVIRMYLCVRVWAHYSQGVPGWKEGEFYTSWIDGVQLEETDAPSPFHTTFISCPGVLQSEIDIKPNTLNLKSKGKKITCFIGLSEGYDVRNIDGSTILLNGAISAELKGAKVRDFNRDRIPDLKVKFNRKAVIDYLKSMGFELSQEVELTITGEFYDGTPFAGSDTIKLVKKRKRRGDDDDGRDDEDRP